MSGHVRDLATQPEDALMVLEWNFKIPLPLVTRPDLGQNAKSWRAQLVAAEQQRSSQTYSGVEADDW